MTNPTAFACAFVLLITPVCSDLSVVDAQVSYDHSAEETCPVLAQEIQGNSLAQKGWTRSRASGLINLEEMVSPRRGSTLWGNFMRVVLALALVVCAIIAYSNHGHTMLMGTPQVSTWWPSLPSTLSRRLHEEPQTNKRKMFHVTSLSAQVEGTSSRVSEVTAPAATRPAHKFVYTSLSAQVEGTSSPFTPGHRAFAAEKPPKPDAPVLTKTRPASWFLSPSLSSQVASPPENHWKDGDEEGLKALRTEAAHQTVADLQLRALRLRAARNIVGNQDILEDDKDSANIDKILAEAEANAQVQLFERARSHFLQAIEKAEIWLKDLERDLGDVSEIDRASEKLAEAQAKLGSFYLDRGHAVLARKVLTKAVSSVSGRSDAGAWRVRMLDANALRDAGAAYEASESYTVLLAELEVAIRANSPLTRMPLDLVAAEVRGELSRALLMLNQLSDASEQLVAALNGLQDCDASSTALLAKLSAWLGVVQLKMGLPEKSLGSLEEALAGLELGKPGAVLAEAKPWVQEIFQVRARARLALGEEVSAAEDLEAVRSLQDEMWTSIASNHNPKFLVGGDNHIHPDPMLRASMARTRLITAEISYSHGGVDGFTEAVASSLSAQEMLSELIDDMPVGPGVATVEEAEQLLVNAKLQYAALAKRLPDAATQRQ